MVATEPDSRFAITAQLPTHADAVEALADVNFGPDRLSKTSYRLRDGLDPVAGLSFVALLGEQLVGTIRFWQVRIPCGPKALLLGPLATHPDHQGQGIGRALMSEGLDKARNLGWQAVLLVGDAPYYSRFGFDGALTKNLTLPGPVDPARFLGLELTPGTLNGVRGEVGRVES